MSLETALAIIARNQRDHIHEQAVKAVVQAMREADSRYKRNQ
jgi:hypothetical protein